MYSKLTIKLFIVLSVILMGLADQIFAQQSQIKNDFNLGIQLNQYQQDFGTGIALTSPYFANQRIALRARGNLMFHEHLQNQETTWSPYLNSTFGVAGKTGQVGDSIRLYGEGGIIGVCSLQMNFPRNRSNSAAMACLGLNFI